MDWASAEWKQALTPLAVQKVNALEEKIEKLQKDRQQKQLQLECQELAFEKEKRKLEREKQHSSELQKELQSLAEVCKDFENKQQKLQNELQSRDSRIKNLEALLSQSRKENSKLQQLESDLKDLSCVRENAISVREQKLQKKMHLFEQSITQDQESNTSMTLNSSNNGYAVKDNVSNNLIDDNCEIEKSLRKKIEEQEELIKELKTKLGSVSRNEEILDSSNAFKTPAKSISVTDSPAVHGKMNAWDVFSSTPAKGNKDRVLGYGDSTSIDSGDEKLVSLQSRLKQLSQELDCQRHNFEASKNALELKYKESESNLKSDLKFQIQANTELDKELKESRNKYQQEINQTTKKMDMLTLQLKKSEEAKVACERDLKNLESQISMNESKLRLKEEELQDLRKSKNVCEATQQSLQSKIRELEKNCKVLVEENSSLSENARATQMQLEGSNNLVKEKETSLHNVQHELTNLQLRMKELENNFTTQEARLKESKMNETLIAEQFKFLTQEKKELNDSLNTEIKRSQNAESSIEEQTQKILLLKEELNAKALNIDELKNHLVILNNEYQMKVCDLENKFQAAKEEHSELQNVLYESTSKQTSLKEKLEQLEQSNKELFININEEKNRNTCLKLNLEEETQKILSLKEELSSKCFKLEELQNQFNISRNEFETNKHRLEKELCEMSSKEATLVEKIGQVGGLNKELSDNISAEKERNACLALSLEEGTRKILSLEEHLASKCIELEELQNEMKMSRNQFENKIQELNDSLNFSHAKITSLESELDAFSLNANNINEKLNLSEQEKLELSNQLKLTMSEVKQLELCIKKEKGDVSLLKEKLDIKCVEFDNLSNQIKILKDEDETNKHELKQKLHAAEHELSIFKDMLNESSLMEASLRENIQQTERLNAELSANLNAECSKNDCLKINSEEQSQKMLSLEKELASKSLKLEDFGNQMAISRNKFESEIQEHISTLNSSQVKIASLETELNSFSSSENNLKKKLVSIEQEKLELWNHLNMKTSEVQQLGLCIEKRKEECSLLKEKLEGKCVELDGLKNQMKVLRECEVNSNEMKQKFHIAIEQLGKLQNQLRESSLMEVTLKEEINQLIESNKELSDTLNLERDRIKCLQLNLQQESRKLLSLEEESTSKARELEELQSEILLSKNQFESDIQALETQLSAATSNENAVEEKLKSAEQEKLELTKQLELASLQVVELKYDFEEEREAGFLLKEKLGSYCVQLEELSSHMKNLSTMYETKAHEMQEKFSSVEAKSMLLESQFKEYSLYKISSEEKIDIAEKEKKEVLNQLMSANSRIQKLELGIEDEKQICIGLNEDMANYCVEFEKLNCQIRNLNELHKGKVLELETKFSSVEAKSMVLETQLKELSSNKISAKENSDIIEKEKKELLNQITSATIKIQELEACIVEKNQVFSLLKEDLEEKCVQVEDLDSQINVLIEGHKISMHELEERFHISKQELGAAQEQLNDGSLMVKSLKCKIDQLESSNKELADDFSAERDINKCIQQSLQEEAQKILLLNADNEELTNQMVASKSQFKNKIQSLEAALSSSSIRITSLEAEYSNVDAIKEKLERVIQENSDLSLQLKSEGDKVQQLESSIKAEMETFSLLKEKLDNKCLEIEDLYRQVKEYEISMLELEEKLHISEQELGITQNQLHDSSLMEKSLKVKIEQLENSNKDLADNFSAEWDRNKCIQQNLQEEAQKMLFQTEREGLINQMAVSKSQFEKEIQSLEAALSSSSIRITSMEAEYSNVDTIKEKLERVMQENSDLSLQLKSEGDKVQLLESSIEVEKETFSLLKEKKCLEVEDLYRQVKEYEISMHELEEKLHVSEQELGITQNQLHDRSLIEKSLKDKIEQLENSNKDLADDFSAERDRSKCIQQNLQEEAQKILLLEAEREVLTNQMAVSKSQLQKEIQSLEAALSSSSIRISSLEAEYLNVDTIKEKLERVIQENSDLSLQLKLEGDKVQQLESSIEAEKETFSLLKEELDNKCLEVEDLYRQVKEHEENTRKGEELDALKEVSSMFQNPLQDISTVEVFLREEIKKLKESNNELSNNLSNRNDCLQQNLQEGARKILSLEEELSSKSLAIEELTNQMMNSRQQFKETILEIEIKLFYSEVERISLVNKMQEHASEIKSLKLEKDELAACLSIEKTRIQSLELSLEKCREFVISLEEFLSFVESEEQALVKEMSISRKFYENKFEKLENELSLAQMAYTTLNSEKEESTLNEIELKQQLDILIKEKAEVASKFIQFEMATQEQQIKMQELEEKLSYSETHSAALQLKLKETCQIEVSLREDLSRVKNESVKLAVLLGKKIEELETFNSCFETIREQLSSVKELRLDEPRDLCVKDKAIKDYENEIQDLESRLLAAETREIDFQNQLLSVYALKEESLTASLDELEKVNGELTEKLKVESGKQEELQLFIQQLSESCASFEEELLNKVLLLEEANILTNELKIKIENSEVQLFSNQTDFLNHLQVCSMNEKNLKSSLTVFEKDNMEISEKLTAELLKTENLELLVEELKESCTSLSEQIEEVNRQKVVLLSESQKTIQNLQEEINDVQSKNFILGNEVKCCLLNEQTLKKSMDSIVKEKQIIYNQLSVEASKVRILETGIGELKRMIMALQVMLLCNNDDTNWAYRKMSTSKELYKDLSYQRKVQSPDKFNLKSTTPKKRQLTFDSIPMKNLAVAIKDVDSGEMASVQSYKKIEYSQALHKLSHFLREINSLEQGLIAKLEVVMFLHCYKLFEKKELPSLVKKFLLLTKRLQIIQFIKKFMSCVCNILKSNIVSCEFANGERNLTDLLLSEMPHLSTQDIFYLCGDTLNRVLFSVSQTLQENKIIMERCSINKYNTVHGNLLPVVANTKFLIYLHHLSRSYINSELRSFKQNQCMQIDGRNVLGVLKVQDVPYFMNYAVALTEYIAKLCSEACNILQLHPTSTSASSSPVPYFPLFECKGKNKVPSETTNDLSIENNSLREECGALQNVILAEKEKQLLLNATIEGIEQDLGETFQQKEKYMKMVSETSKVLALVKKNISAADAFLMIKLGNELSEDSCYCEMCIQQGESEGNSSHEKLTLTDLFECIRKLVELGSQVETKLHKLTRQETELTSLYRDLQDRNSELEMAVASSNVGSKDTHDVIETLKYNLLKEKENYRHICETADEKDSLILQLGSTNSDLSIANEQYKMKLVGCKEKILKLSTELEEFTAIITSKKEEIEALKQAMAEKVLVFENVQLQCKEYESKIQLLNSTISKFEEEKALNQHLNSFADGKSQKTISELQDKIESLKKANDSLNLTIETIEEELRTAYSEKQELEGKATNATQKYVCEQQANKDLLSKIETYENLNITSVNIVKELKRKKEVLDKDVSLLKGILRDHEQVILKNNSSLKLKNQIIDRLNLKISEIKQENLDLNRQLEENVSIENPLKLQLNELTEQCCIFEEEIKRLKLVEAEKVTLLENLKEMEFQRDSLIKDANVLRIELEKVSEQSVQQNEKTHEELTLKYKETCEALNKETALRNSFEKELSNTQNEFNDLDNRFQKLKATTEQFRLLNLKQEEGNRVLSQRNEDLVKAGEVVKDTLDKICQRKDDELVGTRSPAIKNSSDFHNLKNLFANAIQFIINILDITIQSTKSNSSYPEVHHLESSLLSALQYWKQCSETVPKTETEFNEMFDNLKSFYGTLADKRGEELAIRGHVKSIIYTLTGIGQFCESGAQKYQTSNEADVTNMSMFETTTIGDLAKVNLLPRSLVTELQQIKKLLDEYFSSMKTTINRQAEEVEMIQAKFKEMSLKQVSCSAEPDEKVDPYIWKYNIMKRNNQKMEKDYNKLAEAYHEMEERIKTLEKEKQSLEEEAEDLANDFKKVEEQLYNSNELAETLTQLVQTQQKLKECETEKDWLKQKLQYCQSNHGKKAILASSGGATNILATSEHKENVLKNGNDKFIP